MGCLRTETMADGGMRNGNVSSDQRAGLDPPTAALVQVASALAEGKIAVLQQRLAAARAAAVPDLWVEELRLKGVLVVGSPLALVAFGVWREVGGLGAGAKEGAEQPDGAAEQLAHEDWEAWARRGADVCKAVYGRAYHKLLLNLRALHPALEDLVLVDAYGKGIGRPGLDLKRRELWRVATNAGLGAAVQRHTHLRA